MKLSDFIDLDRCLRRDSGGADPAARQARDRRIGRAAIAGAGDPSDEALLLAWREGVSAPGEESLGSLVAGAVRWTAFLLVLFGLASGAGVTAVLLRYDGTQPINVLVFLGTVVGLQLLLLPLLLLAFLFRSRLRRGFRLARMLVAALLGQILRLLSRLGASPEAASRLRAELGSLRAGQSLYARVQPLVAFTLVQVVGVAFNTAVAATLFLRVVFSDLTFSWGTTIQVEPEQIHRATALLSAPWAGIVPQARPSLELVEATRFVRMNGAFVTADPDPALRAGGWWPFLLAATVTYGLLPRLFALLFGGLVLRREMRIALARSGQVQELRERLKTPLVAVEPGGEPDDAATDESAPPAREAPAVEAGLRLAAVFWAYDELPPEEAVSRLLEQSLGASVAGRLAAGGIDFREEDVLKELTQLKDRELAGAAVFFEPFEPPKTDARRFLRRLREAMGPTAPLVVFLAEFSDGQLEPLEPADWMAWDRAIRGMGDPWLFLQERKARR